MKIRPSRAGWFHADGQTDGYDEANNRFFAILRNPLKTDSVF